MQTKRQNLFTTVRTEGAILPADLLQRIAGGRDLDGLTPEAYHLAGERLNDAINDAWNRLTAEWGSFREALAKLPEAEPATSVTRERWLLPLFQELGYGRLDRGEAVRIEDKTYPVSHAWQKRRSTSSGSGVDLDRRAGADGAASPHGLVQEFLNRSDDHLWALVSNGRRLRVLRDNVEPDPTGVRRVRPRSDDGRRGVRRLRRCSGCSATSRASRPRSPRDCWLERWSKAAQEQGHARPGPAPRRGRESDHRARAGLPRPPGQRGAARRAADRASRTPGLLPPAPPRRLPAAVPVRRRGPGLLLDPGRSRGGPASGTPTSTRRHACGGWPSGGGGRATRTCTWA